MANQINYNKSFSQMVKDSKQFADDANELKNALLADAYARSAHAERNLSDARKLRDKLCHNINSACLVFAAQLELSKRR